MSCNRKKVTRALGTFFVVINWFNLYIIFGVQPFCSLFWIESTTCISQGVRTLVSNLLLQHWCLAVIRWFKHASFMYIVLCLPLFDSVFTMLMCTHPVAVNIKALLMLCFGQLIALFRQFYCPLSTSFSLPSVLRHAQPLSFTSHCNIKFWCF